MNDNIIRFSFAPSSFTQILLVHEASKGSFSRVFDFEANDLSEDDSMSRTRCVHVFHS